MAWKACRRRMHGVTLVEILVGLVVLGVLVAIAIPAYRGYVIRVNRSDARRDLLALAAQLHRCHERAGDFRVEAVGSSRACVNLPMNNAEGTYALSFADPGVSASGFKLVATPRGAQAADAGCAALTLDEAGRRGITGSSRAPEDCWQGSGE